jgi:DNA-binding transcriptional regulator YiaG
MTDLPWIKSVRPLPAPYGLLVVFKDGRRVTVDMTGAVHQIKAFAPLRDPAAFRRVRVVDYGGGIGWDGELDYGADSLAALADAQTPFTGKHFRAWQTKAGLSNREAADVLGVSLATIKNYREGSAAIPPAVALACRALEGNPALLAARFRPRAAGRPRKARYAA